MTQENTINSLPATMQAMVFEKAGTALVFKELSRPEPSAEQVLIKVIACGVCRTDLHIIDGELKHPNLPLVIGHEVIGKVVKAGEAVSRLKPGNMVGVPWLAYACGHCKYCKSGKENLCENAEFTGYTVNGGYAEYMVANEPTVLGCPIITPERKRHHYFALDLSASARIEWLMKTQKILVFMALVLQHLSWYRWRCNREKKYLPLPGPAIRRARILQKILVLIGQAEPMSRRRKSWMLPFCLRLPANWCR